MKNETLDEETDKEVVRLSEEVLKFLDDNVRSDKYSHINMCLNILTVTIARISDTFLPDMEAKKTFAIHIAKVLILNYENNP